MDYGDILLNNDSEIFGVNGDLAHGDGIEQQVGAIVNADCGNFRRHPTMAANLSKKVSSPLNSRNILTSVVESIKKDGWELNNIDVSTSNNEVKINILDAVKVTDKTGSLI